AFTGALREKYIRVKRSGGQRNYYIGKEVTGDANKKDFYYDPADPNHPHLGWKQGLSRYSGMFVKCYVANVPKDSAGNPLYDRDHMSDVGFALQLLEIGGPLPAKYNNNTDYDGDYVGKDEWSVLKEVRGGDSACTSSHAFMVGDVRYTLKFGGKTRYLNQSGLIKPFVGKKFDWSQVTLFKTLDEAKEADK